MAETDLPECDILASFAKAIEFNDVSALENLLCGSGTFDIQVENLDTVEVDKKTFIHWITKKLRATSIYKTDTDICLHCALGNRVVLFNDGQFPRQIKGTYERSKTGLMLGLKDQQILTIKFCYVFAETENPYVIECKRTQSDG